MATITIERELLEQAVKVLDHVTTSQTFYKDSRGDTAGPLIDELRAALSAPATAPEQCWCDEQGIGEPGVSCGDCPTRDYKATAPEQPKRKPMTTKDLEEEFFTKSSAESPWAHFVQGARAAEAHHGIGDKT